MSKTNAMIFFEFIIEVGKVMAVIGGIVAFYILVLHGTGESDNLIYNTNDFKTDGKFMYQICGESIQTMMIICDDSEREFAFIVYNKTAEEIENILNECKTPKIYKQDICAGDKTYLISKENSIFIVR